MWGYLSSPRSGAEGASSTLPSFLARTFKIAMPSVIYAPAVPLRYGGPMHNPPHHKRRHSELRGNLLQPAVSAVKSKVWMLDPLRNTFNWCTFGRCAPGRDLNPVQYTLKWNTLFSRNKSWFISYLTALRPVCNIIYQYQYNGCVSQHLYHD